MMTHLWQSTLFAAAAGLLTMCLRNNRAAVRYGVWLAASLKFLIPFSWLIAIGSRFGWHTPNALAASDFSIAMSQVIAPQVLATAGVVPPATASASAPSLTAVLMLVWTLGAIAVLSSWWRQWRPIRSALSHSVPLRLDVDIPELTVAVRSSADLMEPGIVGILRPILLLPAGIADRLQPAELRTIVAHECCHVRRRDNLAAAMHMVVETCFWFHPLVWWIEARLVDERERACDEDVLRSGSAPDVYANGILNVCRFYVESPVICASGVTGANLKRRIEAIMNNRIGVRMNVWKKLLVGAAAAATLAAPIVAGAARSRTVGQAPVIDDEHLAFDTASVRASKGDGPSNFSFGAGGRFTARNMALRPMMMLAFRIHDFQIVGKQTVLDDSFDIVAKAEGNPRADQLQSMLRALLKDRFKIAMHTETRELPVFTLAMARKDGKTGTDLRPSGADCLPIRIPSSANFPNAPPPPPPPPGAQAPADPRVNTDPNRVGGSCGGMLTPGLVSGRKMTMTQFANLLARFLNSVVIDQTGLTGDFDIDLVYTPDQMPQRVGGFAPLSPPADGPSIFTAVQEQLGLKLEPGKGPVPVLVIDHIELPRGN